MEYACEKKFEDAQRLLVEGRYDEALTAFSECIVLFPELEGGYGNRGVTYLHLGNDEAALEDFQTVIRLNQEDALAYGLMAEALKNLGRDEEALEAAAMAIELDPRQETARFIRGWLFARAEQYAEAVEDLQVAVESLEEPDEIEEFLNTCQFLASASQRSPSFSPAEREAYLADRGFSFRFTYNPNFESEGRFCPYAHCIRNLPRRGWNTPFACPLTSHQCPGGEEQVAICVKHPPVEMAQDESDEHRLWRGEGA